MLKPSPTTSKSYLALHPLFLCCGQLYSISIRSQMTKDLYMYLRATVCTQCIKLANKTCQWQCPNVLAFACAAVPYTCQIPNSIQYKKENTIGRFVSCCHVSLPLTTCHMSKRISQEIIIVIFESFNG